MDKVRLLKRHMTEFEYSDNSGGEYVGGIFVPSSVKFKFLAAPFPVDGKTINLYPQGAINAQDLLIYTKKSLKISNATVENILTKEKFTIFDNVQYGGISDLFIYLLKRVVKNA